MGELSLYTIRRLKKIAEARQEILRLIEYGILQPSTN